MSQIPITRAGADRLRAELDRLRKVERPAVIEAIAEARAHGDLKENAEYHAARDQQGFIEGRIQELESALGHARVIDVATIHAGTKVVFGARVTLLEEIDGAEEATWQIVGDLEADVKERRLAISAPLARALIGKQEGDVVEFEAPNGLRVFEIVEVSYTADR
ncbi:MAG: transcription elongation factor GreA [Wenzhouxiangella sp.]|nr:MAG: transcription elongation factor GreA [Wenzhouxiangella sp.]